MRAKEIKKELGSLDKELRSHISSKGSTAISRHCGYSKSDITDYITNAKVWSWKKILEVADKVGL